MVCCCGANNILSQWPIVMCECLASNTFMMFATGRFTDIPVPLTFPRLYPKSDGQRY